MFSIAVVLHRISVRLLIRFLVGKRELCLVCFTSAEVLSDAPSADMVDSFESYDIAVLYPISPLTLNGLQLGIEHPSNGGKEEIYCGLKNRK